jgi:hypothetical protein
MLKWRILLIGLFLSATACAESLDYAIYSLPLFFGEREKIAEGRLVYSHDDVRVERGPIENIWNWRKTLPVAAGFEIGTTVHRDKEITGFGLWMKKGGQGFSWEWFRLEGNDVFRKLQGPGRVRVRLAKTGDLVELASIEFLEDVTFRLNTLPPNPFLDKDTYNLVVKKGSILWLAP